MLRFIQRHAKKIIGMLNGWDRLRLRGTFRWLANVDGMESYLYQAGVPLKDFRTYALAATEEVRKATARTAEEAGRPVEYLDSSATRKVQRGEFLLNGFRNRDLRALRFGTAEASSSETRREASAVTRKLRLLRAHGLIRKVPKTHRYLLTPRGQSAIAALSAARKANTAELAQLAA